MSPFSLPFTSFTSCFLLAGLAGFGAFPAVAQTIERIRLTDNELSCQQIYAEIQQMDTAMQLAGPGLPSAPAGTPMITQGTTPRQPQLQQALPSVNAMQGAVIVDPNVQAAIARARAQGMSEAQINATLSLGMQRGGLGVPTGATLAQMQTTAAAAQIQQVSGLAGLFAGFAGVGATAQAAAPVVATPAPVQVTTNSLGAQAKARKDHLTGFFVTRGCRMSGINP